MKSIIRIAVVLMSCVLSGHASAQEKYSLVIGVDGMGVLGTYGFANVSTPNMDSLINGTWQAGYNGGYSDSAFSGGVVGTATEQITVSGPSWSSILTGTWSNQHGVTSNSTFGNNNKYATHNAYLETLEENVTGIITGSAVHWSPIDTHIMASVDDGDSSLDYRANLSSDSTTASTAATQISSLTINTPGAVFVHLLDVDSVGHASGSGSVNYGNAITTADTYVGQMLAAVAARANFANEDWQIVITADHGHLDAGGHGGQTEIERTIPFIVASSSVQQGDLTGAVSIVDVAPTVIEHFGLTQPDNYVGVSRAVPEPSSFVLLGLAGLCVLRRRRT